MDLVGLVTGLSEVWPTFVVAQVWMAWFEQVSRFDSERKTVSWLGGDV